eukprot:scaffold72818_cov57-Phaeocystis_antarctica.AAC.6
MFRVFLSTHQLKRACLARHAERRAAAAAAAAAPRVGGAAARAGCGLAGRHRYVRPPVRVSA